MAELTGWNTQVKTEYGSHQSKNDGNQMDSGKNQPSSLLPGFFPGLTFFPPDGLLLQFRSLIDCLHTSIILDHCLMQGLRLGSSPAPDIARHNPVHIPPPTAEGS